MPSHTETVLANPRKIGTLENQIQTAQLEPPANYTATADRKPTPESECAVWPPSGKHSTFYYIQEGEMRDYPKEGWLMEGFWHPLSRFTHYMEIAG